MSKQSGVMRAQEIMGSNFFGLAEARKFFPSYMTRAKGQCFPEVPWSVATLRKCRETHVLMLVPPISLRALVRQSKRDVVVDSKAYFWSPIVWSLYPLVEKELAGWALLRKSAVPGSHGLAHSEQVKLLSKVEAKPSLRLMLYGMLAHFYVSGERLLSSERVRCSDVWDGHYYPHIGWTWNCKTIDISAAYLGSAQDDVGIASLVLPSSSAGLLQ